MEQSRFQPLFGGFAARRLGRPRVQVGRRVERHCGRFGCRRGFGRRHRAFEDRPILCHERTGVEMERFRLGSRGGFNVRVSRMCGRKGPFPSMGRSLRMWKRMVSVHEWDGKHHSGQFRLRRELATRFDVRPCRLTFLRFPIPFGAYRRSSGQHPRCRGKKRRKPQ